MSTSNWKRVAIRPCTPYVLINPDTVTPARFEVEGELDVAEGLSHQRQFYCQGEMDTFVLVRRPKEISSENPQVFYLRFAEYASNVRDVSNR